MSRRAFVIRKAGEIRSFGRLGRVVQGPTPPTPPPPTTQHQTGAQLVSLGII